MEAHSIGLDLLVFRMRGSRFGLDVAQIGELLRPAEAQLCRRSSAEPFFAFRNGVEIPVVEIGAIIGMTEPVPPEEAKLVFTRSAGRRMGFLIGEPEEMVRVEAEDIDLLPALIRPIVKGSGMWGIIDRKEGAVILLDLEEAAGRVAVGDGADPIEFSTVNETLHVVDGA